MVCKWFCLAPPTAQSWKKEQSIFKFINKTHLSFAWIGLEQNDSIKNEKRVDERNGWKYVAKWKCQLF